MNTPENICQHFAEICRKYTKHRTKTGTIHVFANGEVDGASNADPVIRGEEGRQRDEEILQQERTA